VLTVRGLRKVFPSAGRRGRETVALDAVDLDVPEGAFVSVLGPSGSGKTTLLRCIAGFERPDAGVVSLRGRELASSAAFVRAHARGIGVVPQEGALFPHLTVGQNIGFGLTGRPRKWRRDRVARLLELVGLDGMGGRRPDQLSGGQQQRVALARALAPEPALLLLDESFSALDARLRGALREEVRGLLRAVGATAVLVTHDQGEAMSLSDHLVVMRDGRVVAAGDPGDVYERPADVEVGRFLGDALVLPGEIGEDGEGLDVVCALGRLEVGRWHGGRGGCQVLVRPEHIRVRNVAEPAGPQVAGTVADFSYFGHDTLLRLAVPGIAHPVPVRVSGHTPYREGDRVALEVVQPVCTYPK
jgi:iron(III) transport system ATP-binding protein